MTVTVDSTLVNGSIDRDGFNDIAVIGMGCKFAGVNTVEEFWHLLDAGISKTTGPPPERFPTFDHGRSNAKSVFHGNFLEDVASFDHRFFKKSSREAASMDPQQRLLLEVAYQALESSGYFGPRQQDHEVGCFVGVCASDYNDNVASHPPNAFSTLGTLRAFLTGKISHFFGFSGPSVTFDTACSSSAVAIDAACKAIKNGDCTSAIAGGVSIFTSPHFFQNLAAASFLSPTGATKSFDGSADGYCRGEGIGLVVLKKMSQAIIDGDHILGTILSTSVQQSGNQVPITVPHSPSQTALYRKVLKMAGVNAEEVSYLEAHGTGTPIGDPQEFEGIKDVFGSASRTKPLHFASVKGNIGHTEGASGVAGLIKILLMMQKQAIPRQASYSQLNPKIHLDPKFFNIPTQTVEWTSSRTPRVACINNYGAAGSITAMVIREHRNSGQKLVKQPDLAKYPIVLAANSAHSLIESCNALRHYISLCHPSPDSNALAAMAFNLADKQNRSLRHVFTTTVTSMSQLDDELRITGANPDPQLCLRENAPQPVVLVFGGQTSRHIGLRREVYDECEILRTHLDSCNHILKRFGHQGIYPAIFDTEPLDDVVLLQSMQFALHYACARSWLSSGLEVDCIVGHSFGQLVALTIAGVFSLEDGLKLVYGRARLMQKMWGPERGSMIALDADHGTVVDAIASVREKLLPTSATTSTPGLEVACYNGPRSHVLVGSSEEIELVVELLRRSTAAKYKVLDVTHGFHSQFCDPILPSLQELASSLSYHEPQIRIETASQQRSWDKITPELITDHTRSAVYFEDAIKRIEARYGSCTWIEAGSNSSVTSIVRRSLSDTGSRGHTFCPVSLSRDDALGALANTTTNLWKNGHRVQYWPFHRMQRKQYEPLNMPPYQFEKQRHWLDLELDAMKRVEAVSAVQATDGVERELTAARKPELIAFAGIKGSPQEATFAIDPRSDEWLALVTGHAVLEQPLCPAPLYVELVLQASQKLMTAKGVASSPFAQLENLEITSSLGLAQSLKIDLVLTESKKSDQRWDFVFRSRSDDRSTPTIHAVGTLQIVTLDDTSLSVELDRASRLLRFHDFEKITSHPEGNAVQGSLVYKIFSRVVQYHGFYKGIRSVASADGSIMAQVMLPEIQTPAGQGLLSNPVAIDNFLQVPGIYANCLLPCPSDEVYVCTHVDKIQISQAFNVDGANTWNVCAMSHSTSEKEMLNDVFVLDSKTQKLVMIAFGVRFNRVRIASLAKVLARANDNENQNKNKEKNGTVVFSANDPLATTSMSNNQAIAPKSNVSQDILASRSVAKSSTVAQPMKIVTSSPETNIPRQGIEEHLRETLSKVTDVPAAMFQGKVSLADLGIDSLMATEIVSTVDQTFGVTIPQDEWQNLLTFEAFCDYLIQHSDVREQNGVQNRHYNVPSTECTQPETATLIQESVKNVLEPSTLAKTLEKHSNDHDQLIGRLSNLLASHLDCQPSDFTASTNLSDCGLDSLLCIELMNDLDKVYGVKVDLSSLTNESTFAHLTELFLDAAAPGLSALGDSDSTATQSPSPPTPASFSFMDVKPEKAAAFISNDRFANLSNAASVFETLKSDYSRLADRYQLTGFYDNVFRKNSRLVLAYTVEAFYDLGIDLSRLASGDKIPQLQTLAKHSHLRNVLYEILRDGLIADYDGTTYFRSEQPLDSARSSDLFNDIVAEFPQHAKEHMLLNLCGAELAKLLSGAKEPLTVLFGSKQNRDILEDVYSTSPMYVIMSQLLTTFLEKTLSGASPGSDGVFHILELGAGTGSTTRWVVDRLVKLGIPIEYTFTDISSSLVAAGKRKFGKYSCVKYASINIEKDPPADYLGRFDIVLSTNCIHATSDLRNSLRNIKKMLRPNGFVSLVEFTSRMYWFDMVFGLLEGWWLFNDGRPYVLATPEFWQQCMRDVGFEHVSWTGGSTRESEIVRVITGYRQPVDKQHHYHSIPQIREGESETVVFAHTDQKLPLRADLYYPSPTQATKHKEWTVGLMIHGGGHVMLSRKDVRPRQTQLMLDNGILPISVDYRLCPETTILEGPMNDVSDAQSWACNKLPTLKLNHLCPRIEAGRIVVVGWSTGGTLAMSLAWTSVPRGLPPPVGILVFYCPTDYEDTFWRQPNIPDHSSGFESASSNVLESVYEAPITAYNVPPSMMAAGGWMTPKDARSRLVLHMNWHAQTLPVLFQGLPHSATVPPTKFAEYTNLEFPTTDLIVRASPHAQIVRGNYKAPTHIVFGTKDDLIPWQQAQRTVDAMKTAGIESGLTLLDGQPHLFDMYRDVDGKRWNGVLEGYRFLLAQMGKKLLV